MLFRSPDLAEHTVSYCCIGVLSENEKDVVLSIGSDDGVKVWLNGKLVHANKARRGAVRGEDKVPARLQKGFNLLLFKIDNVIGSYQLMLDILNQEGKNADGLRFTDPSPYELKTYSKNKGNKITGVCT